jgi:predicted lipoprotein with Yx(FWY)xxD motif
VTAAPRRTVALVILAAVAGVVVLFLVLARHSSSGGTPSAVRPRAVALRVADSKLGRILVDQNGRTLYLFLQDRHGRTTCFDSCARVWPPMIASGKPQLGPGVSARKVSSTPRPADRSQVVYNGHPLYTNEADTRPGETAGEGFFGTWFVVSPAGRLITTPGVRPSATGY